MSDIVPPCDCIELVDGQYTYRCECSNRDDGERVSAWCVEANYKASADYDRATIEFLQKEATEAADEITALRAEVERLRAALEEAIEYAEQDYLTPAGEAMVGRWRAALDGQPAPGKEVK